MSAVAILASGMGAAAFSDTGRGRAPDVRPQGRPNIVIILADDLGYSDLGAFGGEIRTPNLDRLAKGGLRLTNFHTGPQCTVTRSMLLSGADNHLVGFGGSPDIPDARQHGKPGFEGYLNDRARSFVDVLHQGGYRTLMAGKWHLGTRPESDPSAEGFERSFTLLPGAANHFGYSVQYGASDQGRQEQAKQYREDGKPIAQLPSDFYSSDNFTSKLIEYIGPGHADGRPFFAYLPLSAPHWPLQAPAADIARYRGAYDKGWDAIRAARIKRQRELGLMSAKERAHAPIGADVPWNQLTPQQRSVEARKMEVYAAMVDRLDQNVGRLVAHLKRIGEYDNTIFVMFADNGAEGFAMESSFIPANAARGRAILASGDNSLDSLGSAKSIFWYGPNWGQVSTAPGFRHKHYATEGGTRVVAFITQPGEAGRRGISRDFTTVYDLVPTILDWAHVTRGQDNRLPYVGKSMAQYLGGKAASVHGGDIRMGVEFRWRRSYREGDWKIVNTPVPDGTGEWQLFAMAQDPNETTDVAKQHPKLLAKLIAGWDAYARSVGVIEPSPPGI